MSEQHIYKAMIAVKRRMAEQGLAKSRTAPSVIGGYKFRGIDDLYAALCSVEAEENVIVFPRIKTERTEYQQGPGGKLQTHVHIAMELKFVSAVDGSSDTCECLGEGIDTGDKASGKAQSNAMKQGHLEVYKIPVEGSANDIEAYDEQVGASLERPLASSLAWGALEKELASTLRAARSVGELMEAWTTVYPQAKTAPNGTFSRLTKIKDERKVELNR
jgi:hypothetical protein